jgi:hypothetical protein
MAHYSSAQSATMPKQSRVLQVETINYTDTFDYIVSRQFRNRPTHRAEDTACYDIDSMVKAYQDKLIRSRQEYVPSPSGLTTQLRWASLCFELEQDLFVVVLAKNNASARARTVDEFKITVTTLSPQRAAETLASLRNKFIPKVEHHGPGFFIMTGTSRRAEWAPLEETHRLNQEQLSLHYGEEASKWAVDFVSGLNETGISILCGEAGTGKTSFLRHVMSVLCETHRFYFVPVDNFGLLTSGSLTDFWKGEQREHPDAAKVLVLEDAETLLRERDEEGSPVSTILNLTDGLMTQFIKLHLVATLNCKRSALDKALLRPGRLRFFRDFPRLTHAQAMQIAQHYGLKLAKHSDYSLAEIFASEKFSERTSGAVKEKRPIGFTRT